MSIKSKINELSLQERRQLSHAFDQGFSQYIATGDTFVGVNIDTNKLKQLRIEEEAGVWSTGMILKS